ncbi:MAG: hypothetical protein P9X24_11360 [Candidatus Hatepunaea meridiana]|nr:hypothetical protein [Candidatus Hatepunaea meridiana]
MHLKIIKNEEEHDTALKTIEELMDLEPDPGTPDGDKLETLSLLVEDYESRIYPIEMPDPIEAIKFRMEQQNLKQSDLIPYIGSRSKVSEVLSRKRPLSLRMIRALNKGLGISADVLLQESVARESEERKIERKKHTIPRYEVSG